MPTSVCKRFSREVFEIRSVTPLTSVRDYTVHFTMPDCNNKQNNPSPERDHHTNETAT